MFSWADAKVEPKLLLIGAQGLYTSAPATPTTWGVSTVPNSCKAVRSSTLYHELPEDFDNITGSCVNLMHLDPIVVPNIHFVVLCIIYSSANWRGNIGHHTRGQKRSFSRFQLKNRNHCRPYLPAHLLQRSVQIPPQPDNWP